MKKLAIITVILSNESFKKNVIISCLTIFSLLAGNSIFSQQQLLYLKGGDSSTLTVTQFAIMILKVSYYDNQYEIQKKDSKLVNGVYKNLFATMNDGNENDLICFILDQENNPIDSLVIDNPLSTRYEYSEDEIHIKSVIFDKSENEVLIRFNYKSEMKYLLIKKIEKDKSLKAITTLPINFN
jgi:hypothetical protein